MSAILSIPEGIGINHLDTFDFSAYKFEELQELASELETKNQFLKLENTTFEDYYYRCNSSSSVPQRNVRRSIFISQSSDEPNRNPSAPVDKKEETSQSNPEPFLTQIRKTVQDNAGPSVKRKKGDKAKAAPEIILQLTSEQKSEIITRELEELRDDLEHQRSEWTRILDNQRAEIEELEVSHAELKKDQYEFRRDIVNGAVDKRTGKIMAERVLRYYEDRIRAKDTTLEKIRLKNATLKSHKNKLMLQLKQKDEMGEVLHAIDFDQLKIENHQFVEKIEERNAELLKLKLVAGNSVQVMNMYRSKLHGLEEESKRLQKDIQIRQDLLEKLRIESEQVKKDSAKALEHNKTLIRAGKEFSVPSIMDYVNLKTQQEELRKEVNSWSRKVNIARMSTRWGLRNSEKLVVKDKLVPSRSLVSSERLNLVPSKLSSRSLESYDAQKLSSAKMPNFVNCNRMREICGAT